MDNDSQPTIEQIWQQFHEQFYHFILKRVSHPEIAEDLLQEVFLKIHRSIDSLDDYTKVESWIYTIVRNTVIDYYRTRKQYTELPVIPEEDDLATDGDPEQALAGSLREMVGELDEPYRTAIELTEFEGLTQEELGERVGLSHSGAKSRVQRARGRLKAMLLECCHLEFDHRGNVADYVPREDCCSRTDEENP